MSQHGMRTFLTEFKQSVVLRLEAGERIASVAEELKIRRKLLYEWRAAYRKLGAAGLNRKRGRKPGRARQSGRSSLAEDHEIGEAAEKRPACLVWREWKLLRVLRDSRHHGPQRVAKLRQDLRRVRLVPRQRVVKVGPRGAKPQENP